MEQSLETSAAGTVLSVVIPALNEEHGIANILQRLHAVGGQLERIGIRELEVIVVDDGSEDATAEIVERTPGVKLFRHKANRGYGAAIKTGFSHASGSLLAFLDADGTYPPESLAKLCEVALDRRADVVIGSRRSGGESRMPLVRRIGNLIWSSLLSLIGNTTVEDPASGMRVVWRHCLEKLYPLPDGLNFTPVMSARTLHEKLTVVELPIPYAERTGRSKLSIVRDGLRFLGTIIWTVLQYNPARILEMVGFGAMSVAGVIGTLFIVARFNGIAELGIWGVAAAYSGLVLAVGGVSTLSLGIASNYLVALFHSGPIRQPSLVAKVLGAPAEQNFGWIAATLSACGAGAGALSLILALQGWEITRLWFWLLGSALCLLSGIQLALFSMLLRVIQTLNHRHERIGADLGADLCPAPIPGVRQAILSGSRIAR
ncbi:MAG: glycosyltransferase family 2 protein [Acidobacteriales bacterium]|nr:glycosyltransferase family 2 protein [Terriglobales bacterium]